MFEAIQSYLPVEWRRTIEFLGAPMWWIPDFQSTLLRFSIFGSNPFDTTLRWMFLMLPSLLVVVGVWVSIASLYTLPFRAERGRFTTTMAMAWWDAGRSIWFFWTGVVRLVVVLVGWAWGLLRLAARMVLQGLKGAFQSPFVMLDWTSRRYFKPGVPWLAFLLTLAWSALEATIFSYTLLPTMTEVLANITGFEPNRAIITPILWLLLFLLIAGSFACIQVLAQSISERNVPRIVQMAFVEAFVMFFEVIFLYRELIDAITPWVAQQTGVELGLIPILSFAAVGWVGIRGMTWFLFGRYGTPALLAVLSRETITQGGDEPSLAGAPVYPAMYKEAVAALKAEIEWFKKESRHVFELMTLPVLQIFAAALNFPVIAVRSQPVFTLPFRDLDAVLAATPFAGGEERAERRRRNAEPALATERRGGVA